MMRPGWGFRHKIGNFTGLGGAIFTKKAMITTYLESDARRTGSRRAHDQAS